MGRVAVLAGATGLIGGQLLELLLNSDRYDSVIALSRKQLPTTHHKLTNLVCELDQLNDHGAALKCDDVFCCLGTTIKKAKTQEAFLKVDVEAPLLLAKICKEQGAKQYLIVSALGADERSRIFYNKSKGQVENRIRSTGFDSYYIFRPSLLIGPRKEQRAGEDAAKTFYKIFGFLIPNKYQAIESIKVARAMLAKAGEMKQGHFTLESTEIQKF